MAVNGNASVAENLAEKRPIKKTQYLGGQISQPGERGDLQHRVSGTACFVHPDASRGGQHLAKSRTRVMEWRTRVSPNEVTGSGLCGIQNGTWGRGDVGTWGRGDVGTWGRGDVGT